MAKTKRVQKRKYSRKRKTTRKYHKRKYSKGGETTRKYKRKYSKRISQRGGFKLSRCCNNFTPTGFNMKESTNEAGLVVNQGNLRLKYQSGNWRRGGSDYSGPILEVARPVKGSIKQVNNDYILRKNPFDSHGDTKENSFYLTKEDFDSAGDTINAEAKTKMNNMLQGWMVRAGRADPQEPAGAARQPARRDGAAEAQDPDGLGLLLPERPLEAAHVPARADPDGLGLLLPERQLEAAHVPAHAVPDPRRTLPGQGKTYGAIAALPAPKMKGLPYFTSARYSHTNIEGDEITPYGSRENSIISYSINIFKSNPSDIVRLSDNLNLQYEVPNIVQINTQTGEKRIVIRTDTAISADYTGTCTFSV